MDHPQVCPNCKSRCLLIVPKSGYSFPYCGCCAWIGVRIYESVTTSKIKAKKDKVKK